MNTLIKSESYYHIIQLPLQFSVRFCFVDNLYKDYSAIYGFFFFGLLVACILYLLSYAFRLIVLRTKPIKSGLLPYECGFEPFSSARSSFNSNFFLIGLLFLIFDLELALIFPWVANLTSINDYGFWSMFFFLILIILGYLFEWKRGALNLNIFYYKSPK